jgi:hypothetical protein
VRQVGAREAAGCQQLVVDGEQGRGGVQHAQAAPLERLQLAQPGLDAVQRRQHVEPAQDDVARAQGRPRVERRDEFRVEPAQPPRPHELEVRLVRREAEDADRQAACHAARRGRGRRAAGLRDEHG